MIDTPQSYEESAKRDEIALEMLKLFITGGNDTQMEQEDRFVDYKKWAKNCVDGAFNLADAFIMRRRGDMEVSDAE